MMANLNDQSNGSHTDYEAIHAVDGVTALPVTSANTALEDQESRDRRESRFAGAADSTSSSAAEIGSPGPVSPPLQPQSSLLLWNTREGRIAGYKRMIQTNDLPEQRANFEALIKYYGDGGKVPEGDEEVWAFDGQVSFGIRFYTNLNQPPDGCFKKHRYCDVRGYRIR
ncbi:hypothetical protein J7T55_010609 [Diaporthe amygdali]|uniref:uncharacterized protein n=1 Tax=Phomopsis amygdali TaxID=1214568 RepID=UPI0022FE22F7|nr:uncharacterized protein J7T55_010609 [Diaporthe amygdali]KAJ0115786.1 hypothetical protein J7T55_010609 [Diaporthe amygdali]